MKKTLLVSLLMASLFAITSCASKDVEEEVAGPSEAKIAALAEEGAIDLSTFQTPDKFAMKYDDAAYTLTCKGAEFFYFDLPEELIPGETVITVNLKGINNGKEGFRCWVDTGAQKDLSDPVYTDAIGDGLPSGEFDLTFDLNANKGEGGKCLWIKGAKWGTVIDNIVITSVTVKYN